MRLKEGARMPGIDFERVRAEITMQQVLDLMGFQATSVSGDQLGGPCPVHESRSSRSRSFSVNLMMGRYRCFKCGSRGNQLEPWAAVRNVTICDAAIELCNNVGREIPWIDRW